MQTEKFPGRGTVLGANLESPMAKASRLIKSALVPAVMQLVPDRVSSAIRDHFWVVPAVSLATWAYFDSSYRDELVLGLATFGLSLAERKITAGGILDKASVGLFALSGVKVGYDAYSMRFVNGAIDFATAVKLGLIILNKNSNKNSPPITYDSLTRCD